MASLDLKNKPVHFKAHVGWKSYAWRLADRKKKKKSFDEMNIHYKKKKKTF